MQEKHNPERKRNSLQEARPKSGSDQQPTRSAELLKRPPSRASIERAQKVFRKFSLSKHVKGSFPANYSEGNDPTEVHAVQKRVISKMLRTLSNDGPTTQGMTLDLPIDQIKNLLPSYDDQAQTVELSDVLGLITKKLSGTEFYSVGNPTLNRLALQSRVEQIIQSVKMEATKNEY
jgi:hypothetical protein